MNDIVTLTKKEASSVVGGEAITLTLVLTYLAVSILTVIVWKLYTTTKAKVSLPGGALFEWGGMILNPFLFK